MRFSYRYFFICLALLVCLQSAVAAPHAAVRRQDDSPSEESPASAAQESASRQPSATPTPTPSERASSQRESDRPSSTVVSSTRPPESATVATEIPPSASDGPASSSSATTDPANPLPIQPKLTPAMGISGVFLLLSGLAYAIIGIKKKMVYVFGSAAYLTALAVTVLIVYLMNPPVSDAIQGAFFVAAFFTGVIFGILSLVFVDITEGFGCLLGGFCLSMWFLSLKDGGLITSGTGRAIFIGCMAAGGYSLSFSHYTRTYGLIASIAFSGATASILGIDCLAGSGWKELWLYLWNLNDSTFPLNTNTYPVTRNIKAELAGVVIIAVVGIVSQLRVWKMVNEHRAKNAAQQLERQQDQDREEEERGRKVEDNFQKERAQWEAAYGGKSMPDSSIRSSITGHKNSTSVEEKEVDGNDSLEMVNMSKSGVMRSTSGNKGPRATVTVGVLKDDGIQHIDEQGNPITEGNENPVPEAGNDKTLSTAPEDTSRPTSAKRNSLRPSVPPPPPAVIPLPFKVPNEDDTHSDDDNTSVSAVPESDHGSNERKRISKRISDVSAMRHRISRDVTVSQEALITAHDVDDDDDRASSAAATLDNDDDVLSVRQLSPTTSPIGTECENPFDEADSANKQGEQSTVPKQDSASLVAARQSLTASTSPRYEEQRKKQTITQDAGMRADTVMSNSKASSTDLHSKSTPSEGLSQGSQTEQGELRVGTLRNGALPENMSKVALSYRTNEWAKHLEAAEKPDYEDMFLPSSPGVILANGTEEKPAPVSDELVAPLKESKRNSKRMSRNNSTGLQRNTSAFSQDSLPDQRAYTQSPPAALSRANSNARLDVLTPLPSGTLLSKRESLIKNRASALSLTPHSSTANLLAENDEEEMTLAQRRQLLQQPNLQRETSFTSPRKSPPSTSQKWQSKGWAGKGAPAGFNSHQPQRTNSAQSTQKREQLYAGWRGTMREVSPPQTVNHVVEQQRAALLNERRQMEMEKQQREMVQQQRASQMDSMMRSGQMMDAHREAMRKMQANANKHA
ncbi:hypothetical protein DDE82_006120 [Stemphylium lycopersici]|nr:hypothetical protein DDE82_006120 [Stemphylium lycopersici]